MAGSRRACSAEGSGVKARITQLGVGADYFSNPSGGPRGSNFSDHKALLGSAVRY